MTQLFSYPIFPPSPERKWQCKSVVAWTAIWIALTILPTHAKEESSREIKSIELSLALHEPLSPADERLYRIVFAYQEKGKWNQADAVLRKIKNPLLKGHVLAQRYLHPTHYRSRYKELRSWLRSYADHPSAVRIHRLALRRRPARAKLPATPRTASLRIARPRINPLEDRPYAFYNQRRTRPERRLAERLKRHIHIRVRRGWPTGGLDLLESKGRRYLTSAERSKLREQIAIGYYQAGLDNKALLHANAARRAARGKLPLASWYAGLAAWRLSHLDEAYIAFNDTATASHAGDKRRAAGHYWAARALFRTNRPARANNHLRQAAQLNKTFYGILAARSLGMITKQDWTLPPLYEKDVDELARTKAGRRALALIQCGENERAAGELRHISARGSPAIRRAAFAIANRSTMPALALDLNFALAEDWEDTVASALYPLPGWQPRGGFTIDRALIYALMRRESAFRPRAKSPAGARGLMQLMPRTARFVAREIQLADLSRSDLYNPETNLLLAQSYVSHLITSPVVRNTLIHIIASYNGGPGNVARWERRARKHHRYRDPLLFIESIPFTETRNFVRLVLTNFWRYRDRLGQDQPSLTELTRNHWPRYHNLDTFLIGSSNHTDSLAYK